MASLNHRKTIAILSCCKGLAHLCEELYKDRPRNKTVMGLIVKLQQASDAALHLWPGEITKRELDQIYVWLETAERACFQPDGQVDITSYVGLSLDLINDLILSAKDPWKLSALESLNKALLRLCWNLDWKSTNYDAYSLASSAADTMRRLAV